MINIMRSTYVLLDEIVLLCVILWQATLNALCLRRHSQWQRFCVILCIQANIILATNVRVRVVPSSGFKSMLMLSVEDTLHESTKYILDVLPKNYNQTFVFNYQERLLTIWQLLRQVIACGRITRTVIVIKGRNK